MAFLDRLLGKKGPGYDEFGNPAGEMYDLGGGDEERLRGEKILLYVGYGVPGLHWEQYEWHHAQQAVKERGLHMDILYAKTDQQCSLTEAALLGYTQLWFVSNQYPTLQNDQSEMICRYVRAGNGLLIWTDNAPYFADANILAQRLIGTEFSGCLQGDKILVPGNKLARGHFVEHPLTLGINQLYEGITISTIRPAEHLTILAISHDGANCMACYERDNVRIVLDTGFTKLHSDRFRKTAGTARYFRNIAFWLARGARGVQYVPFTPGKEELATINPGGASEWYAHDVTQPTTLTYILHWQGAATLGLVVQDPQGRVVLNETSAAPPIRKDVAAGTAGKWTCQVKGVNVSGSNFPYVLTLAVSRSGVVAPAVAPPVAPRGAPAVAAKRVPVYLVVDSSAGMGDVLPGLERAVGQLGGRLGQRGGAAVAALSMVVAGGRGPVAAPLVEAARFSVPGLRAEGGMMLGAALRALLGALQTEKRAGDSKPLVVVLVGHPPVDGWSGEAAQLKQLAMQKQANVFAVGLGRFADAGLLEQLSPVGPLAIARPGTGELGQFLGWVGQLVEAMLGQLERGGEGQGLAVPPFPPCVSGLR